MREEEEDGRGSKGGRAEKGQEMRRKGREMKKREGMDREGHGEQGRKTNLQFMTPDVKSYQMHRVVQSVRHVAAVN